MSPDHDSCTLMESKHIVALEQALTGMQAKDAKTQVKLDNLIVRGHNFQPPTLEYS